MNEKELSEKIGAALRRAYSLGQTYWQQADSEYTSQHKKADVTAQKFCDLVDETCALVAPTATSTKPADADNYHATIRAFDERMRDPLNKVLAERGGAAGAGEVKLEQWNYDPVLAHMSPREVCAVTACDNYADTGITQQTSAQVDKEGGEA